jgi:N-dimethylarginine dimethylaminohydrolase
MKFNSVLVAKPTFFEVAYAINPYMTDASGQLNKVDQKKAQAEWLTLVDTFRDTGLKVIEMEGVLGLPDIVFTANQSFPFWNKLTQKYEIVLSKMRSAERAQEVPYFETLWKELGFTVHHLNYSGAFEGNGDAIFSPNHGVVFGGYGPRTDKEVYQELSQRFGLEIVPLELRLKDFYHLDTCFSILSKDVAAIQPDAFSQEGLTLLRSFFPVLVEIPIEENRQYFCGNCFCPDGKNVIVQKGSPTFSEHLKRLDFRVWEVETTEFMKSGGSVFCLKLFFPG